jgi:phage gp29-like protein
MAEEIIAKPEVDRIVTDDALRISQYSQYRNSLAFSGVRDPTANWTSMVREDARAITLYRELEMKDDDVSSALDELKLSVLEREWSIAPGDDSQAALDAVGFLKDQINRIDFDSAMDSMLDAPAYGFSVAELMFDASAGQASLLSIDDAPQELFLFNPRFTPQTGQLQFLSSPYQMTGTLVPEEKFLTFTYRGRARSRTGTPLLQRAFWPSWFKRQILGLWLRFGEKGPGTAVVYYADSASDAQKAQAVELAEQLISATAVGVPENFRYDKELLQIARAQDPAVYEKLFKEMQYAIARAIKGETLTSFGNEGGKGSNAQGQTHAETFEKRSVSLAKKSARVLNTQLFRRLHIWNFGPTVPQPTFSWDIEEEDDLTQKLTVFSGLQRMGLPISERYTREEFSMPAIGEGDVALVPNVNAPSVTPPSAAFAEDPETQLRVDAEYADFDRVAANLKRGVLPFFSERVGEIADAMIKGGR